MYHTRSIKQHALQYGTGCHGRMQATAACNTQACFQPRDCQYGNWAAWSVCSRSCGGGQRSRSRSIQRYAANGGKACDRGSLMELDACSTVQCEPWAAVDCRLAMWSDWGPCSATCNGGQQHRSRVVAVKAAHGGKLCSGVFDDFRACATDPCVKLADCQFDDWSDWTTCDDPCSGHSARQRYVKAYAAGGGRLCQGPTKAVRPCPGSKDDCKAALGMVDCIIDKWSDWTDCSQTCGGGQRYASRRILKTALNGGKACDAPLKITQPCHPEPCPNSVPVDCQWGDWGAFSECSATCGGGEWRRHRSVLVEPQNGGKNCALLNNTMMLPCNTMPCDFPTYCVWTDWASWSQCSASCDGGQRSRQRSHIRSSSPPAPDNSSLTSKIQQAFAVGSGSLPSIPASRDFPGRLPAEFPAVGAFCAAVFGIVAVWRQPRRRTTASYTQLPTSEAATGREDEEPYLVA